MHILINTNWFRTRQKLQNNICVNLLLDQPGNSSSMIRAFAICLTEEALGSMLPTEHTAKPRMTMLFFYSFLEADSFLFRTQVKEVNSPEGRYV